MARDWNLDENGVVLDGPFTGSHTRPNSAYAGGDRELVWHRAVPPSENDRGQQVHDAWGLVSVNRVSTSPGAVLFDSDVRHQHYMQVTLKRASRQRDLSRDWINDTGPDLIQIDLSLAQWASFVSSTGSAGVPCTIRATETRRNVDGLPFEPRLQESMNEIKDAADKVFGRMKDAMAEWDALDPKAGVKEKRAVMDKIRQAADHASGNMEFAAKSLEEHAEKVVQKARADVEAMVFQHAERLGLDPKQTLNDLALDGGVGTGGPEAIEG